MSDTQLRGLKMASNGKTALFGMLTLPLLNKIHRLHVFHASYVLVFGCDAEQTTSLTAPPPFPFVIHSLPLTLPPLSCDDAKNRACDVSARASLGIRASRQVK